VACKKVVVNRQKTPRNPPQKNTITKIKKRNALKIRRNFRDLYYLYAMKQRLYIDTSVFGGYFDEEFSAFTRPLFGRLQNGEIKNPAASSGVF